MPLEAKVEGCSTSPHCMGSAAGLGVTDEGTVGFWPRRTPALSPDSSMLLCRPAISESSGPGIGPAAGLCSTSAGLVQGASGKSSSAIHYVPTLDHVEESLSGPSFTFLKVPDLNFLTVSTGVTLTDARDGSLCMI